MANQLKMASIQAILFLRKRGWSFRRIARELGVHRETVSRQVALAGQRAVSDLAPGGLSRPAEISRRPCGEEVAAAPEANHRGRT
jgi:transposase